MAFNLLGISGSLREESYSLQAVNHALEIARGFGAETRLLDLRLTDLPMYRPGDTGKYPAVDAMNESVAWADGFLLGSPDYHGSMSGAMKNFLDYHWEEFAGKIFGYVCASHEKGLTAMEQMRTAVRQCYGWSLPYGVSVHGEVDFDAAGKITNSRLAGRLQMMARDLVVYGTPIREQFTKDLQSGEAHTFAARYR